MTTESSTLATNILDMDLPSCHHSGTQNFEVTAASCVGTSHTTDLQLMYTQIRVA